MKQRVNNEKSQVISMKLHVRIGKNHGDRQGKQCAEYQPEVQGSVIHLLFILYDII